MQTSHKQSSPKLGCYRAGKEMEKAADKKKKAAQSFGLWGGEADNP